MRKRINRTSVTKKLLWTNSAPTASITSTTASLSDSFENYDYVGVCYKVKSADAESDAKTVLFPINSGSYSGGDTIMGLSSWVSGKSNMCRELSRKDATSLYIQTNYQIGVAGTYPENNIPIYIYGIKLKIS